MQLSVKRFLELTITTFDGYTDRIAKEEYEQIKLEDPLEIFCHVEVIHKVINSRSRTIYRLWERAAWDCNYERYKQDKVRQAQRNAEWDKKNRNIDRMAKALMDMSGIELKDATNIAGMMLTRNIKTAEALGVTLEV